MSHINEHKGPSGQEPLLHLDCLSHVYSDGTKGIHELCFKVFPKEIVAICGPNGAGKSTLLEHLNGILIPTDGEIIYGGQRINKGNIEVLRRAVGLVFQDADSQLIAPTVIDDVMFGPMNSGSTVAEARELASWALGLVGFNELKKIPHYLSGGEKRLVAIAGIIAMKPHIVVVDEPTSDLDPNNSEKVERLIMRLRDELGLSVVVSTHDMDLAARIADRLYVLKKGSVIAEGSPRTIFYDQKLLEDASLKPPSAVQMYRALFEEGIITQPAQPLSPDDLFLLLKERGTGKRGS